MCHCSDEGIQLVKHRPLIMLIYSNGIALMITCYPHRISDEISFLFAKQLKFHIFLQKNNLLDAWLIVATHSASKSVMGRPLINGKKCASPSTNFDFYSFCHLLLQYNGKTVWLHSLSRYFKLSKIPLQNSVMTSATSEIVNKLISHKSKMILVLHMNYKYLLLASSQKKSKLLLPLESEPAVVLGWPF